MDPGEPALFLSATLSLGATGVVPGEDRPACPAESSWARLLDRTEWALGEVGLLLMADRKKGLSLASCEPRRAEGGLLMMPGEAGSSDCPPG